MCCRTLQTILLYKLCLALLTGCLPSGRRLVGCAQLSFRLQGCSHADRSCSRRAALQTDVSKHSAAIQGMARCCLQIMEAGASQLSAAVFVLIVTLTARRHDGIYNLSFARWGLEGGASLCTSSSSFSLQHACSVEDGRRRPLEPSAEPMCNLGRQCCA